jgi:hypothetical protein
MTRYTIFSIDHPHRAQTRLGVASDQDLRGSWLRGEQWPAAGRRCRPLTWCYAVHWAVAAVAGS